MGSVAPPKSLSGVITSEDKLVERPGLDLLVELGWTHGNLMKEEPGQTNCQRRRDHASARRREVASMTQQEGPRTGGLFVRHQAWVGL